MYNFISEGNLYADINLSLHSPKSTYVKLGYLFINSFIDKSVEIAFSVTPEGVLMGIKSSSSSL